MKGNKRYIDGVARRHDFTHEREALAGGQNPYAGILSCADSRIAPEYAFDSARGDLFVCRVAGNFANTESVVIQDFQVHTGGLHQADTISLVGFTDHSFDQLVANGHIFQSGADVVISDGTHAFAALQNVSLASLHANDFLFT